jgi:hypothetical protein
MDLSGYVPSSSRTLQRICWPTQEAPRTEAAAAPSGCSNNASDFRRVAEGLVDILNAILLS